MNPNNLKAPKPTIILKCSNRLVDRTVLDTVLYGAEEEGIPVEVQEVPEADALALSHQAGVESTLNTGIGISATQAVVHQGKLPKDYPVYMTSVSAGEDALRKVGMNAARLVKRMPLKVK